MGQRGHNSVKPLKLFSKFQARSSDFFSEWKRHSLIILNDIPLLCWRRLHDNWTSDRCWGFGRPKSKSIMSTSFKFQLKQSSTNIFVAIRTTCKNSFDFEKSALEIFVLPLQSGRMKQRQGVWCVEKLILTSRPSGGHSAPSNISQSPNPTLVWSIVRF